MGGSIKRPWLAAFQVGVDDSFTGLSQPFRSHSPDQPRVAPVQRLMREIHHMECMEEQVNAPTGDEETIIEERVHLLEDEENLEDIESLLEDL